jgi:nitrogen fixation NifU-like protein
MEELISKFFQPGVRSVPANFGPLKGAHANARVTGPCGDTMEFWLLLRGDRIQRAAFTADGCGASIACGAAAARLAEGRTVEEAIRLTPLQVEIAVGNLPKDHKHCPVLALNTLRAALEQAGEPARRNWPSPEWQSTQT